MNCHCKRIIDPCFFLTYHALSTKLKDAHKALEKLGKFKKNQSASCLSECITMEMEECIC